MARRHEPLLLGDGNYVRHSFILGPIFILLDLEDNYLFLSGSAGDDGVIRRHRSYQNLSVLGNRLGPSRSLSIQTKTPFD
jgi:hypothetical protein